MSADRTDKAVPHDLPPGAERTYYAGLLGSVAEEMLETLVRTAYSPNIKERRDCSTAVFDDRGRLIAQATAIPVHLGAMPMSVAAAIEAFPEPGPGDVVVLNDPYRGGTHLPDVTTVSPVYVEGGSAPFAFLAARAHHADMGGATPGSLPLSRDIHEEGLRIPPVRLVEGGEPASAVWEMLLANVRTPLERRGDLRAQVACHETGNRRIAEAVLRHGARSIARQAEALLDYGDRLMRAVVRRIPDGDYAFEDVLDDDGAGTREIPIRVRIGVRGEEAVVDFTGSGPECGGCLNAVEAITRSAVEYCFLGLMITLARREGGFEEPPLNAGCARAIRVVVPPGTIVNARYPRAVAAGNVETSQRIVDVVLGALARALPDVVPAASQGTMNNLALGGLDPRTGQPFAFYETIAGGTGGGPRRPGADATHSHMTNTWNTPVEALEAAYPLRVERYEVRRDSGGRGLHPGGGGVRRDIRALAACRGTLLGERRSSRPYGLAGGEPGAPGEDLLILAGGVQERLPAKSLLHLAPGDRVSIATPGGGGWGRADDSSGAPRSRSPR